MTTAQTEDTTSSLPRWVPMQRGTINPEAQRVFQAMGEPMHEVWSNDIYECQVRYLNDNRDGMVYLSIKRFNRAPLRDWRHLQSIKNEVLGPEREAVELYPAESRLVDQANQTHIWVFPVGMSIPLGFNDGRQVYTQDEMTANIAKTGLPDTSKARQRDWQPGLKTGKGAEAQLDDWKARAETAEAEVKRLLVHASAALERTDVGDAEEATAILKQVVTLGGQLVKRP